MNLGVLIQATGDNPISLRRKHVVENFIGPNAACRRGLVKRFVVIRHDRSLAEHEISMMAGVIVPGEASRPWGRLGRKGCFQPKRFARRQMCYHKMQLSGGAGIEAGAGPLRRDRFSIRPDKRGGGNPFLTDLPARHLHANGDMVTFVPSCCDGEIKRRGITQGPDGSREVNRHACKRSVHIILGVDNTIS